MATGHLAQASCSIPNTEECHSRPRVFADSTRSSGLKVEVCSIDSLNRRCFPPRLLVGPVTSWLEACRSR